MNEFNEPPVLPPLGDLYADSAPSDDALERMLDVAFDPSTPDPGDSLIPGSQEVSLDEFDEGISLDDDGVTDHDPLFDDSADGSDFDDPLPDSPADPLDDPLQDPLDDSSPDPVPDDLPDDPLADF